VELRNLYFSYEGSAKPALKNINLVVDRGEFIVLTGPSGCGKSTLCRVLNGLIPHFYRGRLSGQALVAGLDVKETPTYILARHVGMVFQNPENQLFLSTVERELAFGLENLGLPEEDIEQRVKQALDYFGLADLKDRPPYLLSGGQQQKVAIAAVMIMEPELLILDEPTANLDPVSAEEILELLEKLRKEKNISVLLVEHRLELVLRYATRLLIMREGEIIADGPPERVILTEHANIVGIPPVVEVYKILSGTKYALKDIPLTPSDLTNEIEAVVKRGVGH